jgi:hypothetical protein
MPCPRFALRLLSYGASFGAREELIGDLQEEIAGGRSQWWVCRQLIGLYGFACVAHVRRRARLTPLAVALTLGVVLLAGVSFASVGSVLQVWLGLYYVTGTLSLFAQMISRVASARSRVIPADTP